MISAFFEQHGGGIEIVCGSLAREYAQAGHAIIWAASREDFQTEKPAGSFTRLAMEGVNPLEALVGIPFPIWTRPSLLRLAEAIGWADVIHLHDAAYLAHGWALRRAQRYGKKVVLTQHIGAIPFSNPALRMPMFLLDHFCVRPALARANQVVFISHNVRNEYRNISFRRPPSLIFNGVDRERFSFQGIRRAATRNSLGLLPSDRLCLFVGRAVGKKGLPNLLRLVRRFPETRWLLIGAGTERLQASSQMQGLGKVAQHQLVDYYLAADVLVLLSFGEGFPLVVQEALVSGLPCFVSHEIASACPEVAPYLDATRLDQESVVLAFERCLPSWPLPDAEREKRAVAVQRLWSWGACAQQYLELFMDLIP